MSSLLQQSQSLERVVQHPGGEEEGGGGGGGANFTRLALLGKVRECYEEAGVRECKEK